MPAAAIDAISKEVEENLNESFTSSSEDLMSLINSGLRQGNHEDEEKEEANDLTIIRQEKGERPPAAQQEPNYNDFSLFTNDLFSNTFGKPT